MSSAASVTHWLELLKGGNQSAARLLWEAYFPQLVVRVRRTLRGKPPVGADEEDIALSAFHSFCRGAKEGRMPSINDRRDLWRLLLTITARKVGHLVRDQYRDKRGGGRVRVQADLIGASDEDVLAHALGAEPAPEFCAQIAEEFSRLLEQLGTDELRSIAVSKMEGYTDEEVAARLGKSVRTVARKLNMIRDKWRAWEKLS